MEVAWNYGYSIDAASWHSSITLASQLSLS